MNQILDYNPMNDSNTGKKGGNTDKIVKVFAILLIVFAICLIGIGLYNKIKNSTGMNKPDVEKVKANIVTSIHNSELTIHVSHEKELKKLVYNWNTNPEKNITIDSGNTFETTIDVPAGSNTLNLQVEDIDGTITEYSEEIEAEEGTDIINPEIKLEITEDKKIKIIAKDETELDFVTYRWNDEEEVTLKPEEYNKKEVTQEIDIKTGENTLVVVAVDKSNNTQSEQQIYTGLTQPTIQVVLSEDKSKLLVTCKHEHGISKIEYTLNDKPFAGGFEEPLKEVTFEQPLDEGENTIIITATSIDGTNTTFGGKCTYTPVQVNTIIE